MSNSSIQNKKHILSKRKVMILIALFVAFLWGSAFPTVVATYGFLNVDVEDVFQVMLFAGMRFFISAILLFTFAFLSKKSMKWTFRGFKLVLLLGLLQTFGQYLFFFLSMRTVHPANGSILSSLGVFLTAIIAHFIYVNEKLTFKKIVGLIVGVSGIIILNGGTAGSLTLTGEGFMFISQFLGALAAVYTKKIAKEISPLVISAYQLLFGSILLITLGLTFSGSLNFTLTITSTSALIYLGFISGAAFTLWSALIKHNKVSSVTIFKFAIPVFGVLITFIFMNEIFNLISVVISLIFVALGILLINLD